VRVAHTARPRRQRSLSHASERAIGTRAGDRNEVDVVVAPSGCRTITSPDTVSEICPSPLLNRAAKRSFDDPHQPRSGRHRSGRHTVGAAQRVQHEARVARVATLFSDEIAQATNEATVREILGKIQISTLPANVRSTAWCLASEQLHGTHGAEILAALLEARAAQVPGSGRTRYGPERSGATSLLLLVDRHVTDIDRLAGRNRESSFRRRYAAENDEHPRSWPALDLKASIRTAARRSLVDIDLELRGRLIGKEHDAHAGASREAPTGRAVALRTRTHQHRRR
jgi:hypothetical protein